MTEFSPANVVPSATTVVAQAFYSLSTAVMKLSRSTTGQYGYADPALALKDIKAARKALDKLQEVCEADVIVRRKAAASARSKARAEAKRAEAAAPAPVVAEAPRLRFVPVTELAPPSETTFKVKEPLAKTDWKSKLLERIPFKRAA